MKKYRCECQVKLINRTELIEVEVDAPSELEARQEARYQSILKAKADGECMVYASYPGQMWEVDGE